MVVGGGLPFPKHHCRSMRRHLYGCKVCKSLKIEHYSLEVSFWLLFCIFKLVLQCDHMQLSELTIADFAYSFRFNACCARSVHKTIVTFSGFFFL